ncbi:hypothetical protein [Galbibacter mesophilus]|uniref:hypothetical protein n=1 Tax=Galbibacter mesophilus TaxID=379069 RepID=UPI00191E20A3|nr:hypothetical protein [Galbibacter mesophilus]MCM5662117.1 hypothetical protein [Galbibacter mesophilus]
MNYNFKTHLHNYAVWTASRASQRGFTTTENITLAINKTELQEFAMLDNILPEEFNSFHRKTSKIIIDEIEKRGIKTSYGRAAKIIAIYLKTAVVIKNSGQGNLAKVIHPPIDNILLKNINRAHKELKLGNIKWTYLKENEYFNLIYKLKTLDFEYFWELEEYWNPINNSHRNVDLKKFGGSAVEY